jgi:hypothetical protein
MPITNPNPTKIPARAETVLDKLQIESLSITFAPIDGAKPRGVFVVRPYGMDADGNNVYAPSSARVEKTIPDLFDQTMWAKYPQIPNAIAVLEAAVQSVLETDMADAVKAAEAQDAARQ